MFSDCAPCPRSMYIQAVLLDPNLCDAEICSLLLHVGIANTEAMLIAFKSVNYAEFVRVAFHIFLMVEVT